MTTYADDDFTGANGDPLSATWTTGYTGSGSSAAIQGNRARFTVGSSSLISRRLSGTTYADGIVTFSYWTSGDTYFWFLARDTGTTLDRNSCYGFQLPTNNDENLEVTPVVSYGGSAIDTAAVSITDGTQYHVVISLEGTALKAKVWADGTSEPGWLVEATDSTYASAGDWGVYVGSGGTAGAYVEIDDFRYSDGEADIGLAETVTVAAELDVVADVPLTETVSVAAAMTVAQAVDVMAETVTVAAELDVQADVPLAETVTVAAELDVEAQLVMAETVSVAAAMTVEPEVPLTETVTVSEALSVEVFQLRHDLLTEIEFTADVWTDVSEYVDAGAESTGTFGRPTRFDDVAASTWQTALRNSDGRFTPPNLAKGMRIRVGLTYSGQTYPQFWGRITDVTIPGFTDPADAVAVVKAADIMADLARKTLLSPFVEESRRQARISIGGGCDVFPFPPSQVKTDGSVQVADTSFENKGILFPDSTRLGTVSIMAAGSGAGVVRSTSADSSGGMLTEGQLDFEVGDNGAGRQTHPILVCRPQIGFQQFELFFRIPADVLPPRYVTGTHTIVSGDNWNSVPAEYGMTQAELAELNPDKYPDAMVIGETLSVSTSADDSEWYLVDLWAGSTEILRVVISNVAGKLALVAKKPAGGAQYITSTDTSIGDGKWRKLTIYKNAEDSVRINMNDSPAGAGMSSMAGDLTEVDLVYVGGRHSPSSAAGTQVQCPPMGVAGLACQATRTGVWSWYVLGAPPANVTAQERLLELAAYAHPVDVPVGLAWHSSLDRPFDALVVRTPTGGRSVLDCLQELARTVGGYLWVQPSDGLLTLRRGPTPQLDVVTVDLGADADDQSAPVWRDTVALQPTRVTARCPAGEVTSTNSAAEAANQYRDDTVDTCAATIAAAKAVADRLVTASDSLRLQNLQIDLMHAATSLWGPLLAGLLPTERVLHVTGVPSEVLGFAAADAVVEAWTVISTVDSARIAVETTPISVATAPPLGSLAVTSTTGTQDGATITAAQPAGTTTGDLLVAILTVDDTGSLVGMSAPTGWTAQGSGGTADSGYGQVWTKTATASEPSSYAFTVAGSGGSSVLVSDDFAGTNGAGWDAAKWSAGETRTGASTTLLDGSGSMNPGTGTGYTGRVSVLATAPDKADVDLVWSFQFVDNDSFHWAMLRAVDPALPDSDGIEIRPRVGSAGCRIADVAGYTPTTLGTIPGTLTAGTWYRARAQADGTTVRVRLWPASSAEPSSWGVEATTTITAAGAVALVAGGGDTAAARILVDDATVSDPHAITSIPEARLTVMRIAGADASDPILVAPTWQANDASTTEHVAPSASPAATGLLISHWHTLTEGAGSGGGGGGGAGAFSFGMSRFSSASEITAANAWLTNHSLAAVGFWADSNATVQQEVWGIGPGETFAAWTGIVDIAVGGIFGSETWAQAAGGSFDSRWTTSLETIATKWGSRPPGNLHLRFAHEFNGDWSDWYVQPGDASNFVSAWIRWANLCRSILPGIQIAWSPNDGFSGGAATVENVWPGSDYVDVVCPDSYNAWPHATTKAEFDSKMLRVDGNGNPEGLERWRVWAEGKGKPLALGEWGNRAVNVGDGGGGGDHAVYAQEMLTWMKTHGGFGAGQIKYAIYFNHGPDDGYPPDYEIWPTTRQPLTSAAIRNGA